MVWCLASLECWEEAFIAMGWVYLHMDQLKQIPKQNVLWYLIHTAASPSLYKTGTKKRNKLILLHRMINSPSAHYTELDRLFNCIS